jgi:hypothetical protein
MTGFLMVCVVQEGSKSGEIEMSNGLRSRSHYRRPLVLVDSAVGGIISRNSEHRSSTPSHQG